MCKLLGRWRNGERRGIFQPRAVADTAASSRLRQSKTGKKVGSEKPTQWQQIVTALVVRSKYAEDTQVSLQPTGARRVPLRPSLASLSQ